MSNLEIRFGILHVAGEIENSIQRCSRCGEIISVGAQKPNGISSWIVGQVVGIANIGPYLKESGSPIFDDEAECNPR